MNNIWVTYYICFFSARVEAHWFYFGQTLYMVRNPCTQMHSSLLITQPYCYPACQHLHIAQHSMYPYFTDNTTD